jgi:hypothetical protein
MKKQRRTPPLSSGVRLCKALSCGVMGMLGGADVLRVLRTSGLVRTDADALGCALRTVTATDPRWLWLDPPRLLQAASVAVTAVQLMWRIQLFLHDGELDAVAGDSLRPFVVLKGSTSEVPISLQRAAPRSTVFGSHWDHIGIRQQQDRDAAVECALCEAGVTSVWQYREDTDAFTSEFEAQLTQHEAEWEAQGGSPSEVLEKSFAFQQDYFAAEPFLNTYVASQDDAAVLRYVCERGRFPLALSAGDASAGDALSVAARESCRRAYRPVKQLLSTISACPLVRATLATETLPADVVAGECGELLVGFRVSSPG